MVAAHEDVVAFLRELIRIPSINPPDPPGAELAAAVRIADELRAAGLRPGGHRARPGPRQRRSRGSAATGPAASRCCCSRTSTSSRRPPRTLDPPPVRGRRRRRLRLGPRRRRHEGDGRDGGRRSCGCSPRRARAAGLDPAATRSRACGATCCSPAPPTRRRAAATAPAGWSSNRPETLRAAGALNEAGGVPIEIGRPAVLPDPGGREGLRGLPHPGAGHLGPRLDAPRRQRAVLAAEVVTPHRRQGRAAADAGHAPAAGRGGGGARAGRRPRLMDAIGDDDPRRSEAAIRAACDPIYARGPARAAARQFSPTIMHAASSTTSSRARP